MIARDMLRFTFGALGGNRARTALILTAMAIGVASVVILTSLGEGARRFVVGEFASLGTDLLIIMPGRSETAGAAPALIVGATPRDLTVDDAAALTRSALIRRVAPLMIGAASASWREREREIAVLGSTAELLAVRHWTMSQGRFLPPGDPDRAAPVCVIGAKVRNELFGAHPALGEWMRLGDRRCQVIGVLATEGRSIGMDVEDQVIIPVASAQIMFNSPALFRIMAQASSREAVPRARQFVLDTVRDRHQGEEDITVVTQDAVLATFDNILQALTLTVAGIAAISLAVAGILIMNVMLIAVAQRTAEIGLLKAVGASGRQIVLLFMTEAAMLSLAGALIGLLVGAAGSRTIGYLYPALPVGAPLWSVATALIVALLTGLVFGAMPARRAARLDPVQALSRR